MRLVPDQTQGIGILWDIIKSSKIPTQKRRVPDILGTRV